MSKKDAGRILAGLAEVEAIMSGKGSAARAIVGGVTPKTEEERRLRQLLLELYVSGMLWHDNLAESEQQRLLDTVYAAAEGRPFDNLGLPFPNG